MILIKSLLLILGLLACAEKRLTHEPHLVRPGEISPASSARSKDLVGKMDAREKEQVIESYLRIRSLVNGLDLVSTRQPRFFPGIPRLHIPAVEFTGQGAAQESTVASVQRQEERVLKLGSLNVIRDFHKVEGFEKVDEAREVDRLLGPGSPKNIPWYVIHSRKLEDLDLFIVRSGSPDHGSLDSICAIQHEPAEDFRCVHVDFEGMFYNLGYKNFEKSFLEKKVLPEHLDLMAAKVLQVLIELRLV